jgi:hypothetical protein
MNTTEIDRFVRGDDACCGIFQGVFSAGTLPEKPRLLVGNTDPSDKSGNHWVTIFVDSAGRGDYFDSSDANHSAFSNATRINIASIGFSARNNYRASPVVTAAFTAVSIACLDVEVST